MTRIFYVIPNALVMYNESDTNVNAQISDNTTMDRKMET